MIDKLTSTSRLFQKIKEKFISKWWPNVAKDGRTSQTKEEIQTSHGMFQSSTEDGIAGPAETL